MVKSHMLELSKDKFGCRVIQKCGDPGELEASILKNEQRDGELLSEVGRRQSCFFGDTL